MSCFVASAAELPCGAARQFTIDRLGSVELKPSSAGQLWIRERGVDLKWSTQADIWQGIDIRPPRLGETQFSVTVGGLVAIRALANEPEANFEAQLFCADTQFKAAPHLPKLVASSECLHQVQNALRENEIQPLISLAGADDVCGAFAVHALAHRAAAAGTYAGSHRLYLSARDRWRKLKQPDRAAAALLGAAEQSLNAGFLSRAVSESTLASTENDASGVPVFALRAKMTQAVAMRRQGRASESRNLHLEVLHAFETQQNFGEVVNIRCSLAAVALQDSDQVEFDRQLAQIEKLNASVLTPVVRARVANLRSRQMVSQGRVADALRIFSASQSSLSELDARAPLVLGARWLADIYRSLGMHEESYVQFTRALTISPPADAPHRTASTLIGLAALELDTGRPAAALQWSAAAQTIFERLGFQAESRFAEVMRLQTELQLGGEAGAILKRLEALAGVGSIGARGCITMAKILLVQNQPILASTSLDRSECAPTTLDLSVSMASVRASTSGARGDVEAAQLRLLDYALNLRSLLGKTNRGLAYLVLRRLQPLRNEWLVLERGRTDAAKVERSLRFALATQALGGGINTRDIDAPGLASENIGGLLLDSSVVDDDKTNRAALAMLDGLAQTSTKQSDTTAHIPTLTELQKSLGADHWLLIVIAGEPESLGLWISADKSYAIPMPGLPRLRVQIAHLRVLIDAKSAHTKEFQAAIDDVSASIASTVPLAHAPQKLSVLTDEAIGALPLAVLQWPATGRLLIETTELGWITEIVRMNVHATPSAERYASTHGSRQSIQTVIAANTGDSANIWLEPLFGASNEPALIAASGAHWDVDSKSAANSRAGLLHALEKPKNWVHLAAHGIARPGQLGFAGVWLAPPTTGSEPEFLSWIDMIDRPMHADLAVFNACQLATGPTATGTSSLSFATAAVSAGVGSVVAAAWPVSDGATAIWVPAFYQALRAQQPDSSAAALHEAQQALRRSPFFRHPYHWAAFAHYSALAVPKD